MSIPQRNRAEDFEANDAATLLLKTKLLRGAVSEQSSTAT